MSKERDSSDELETDSTVEVAPAKTVLLARGGFSQKHQWWVATLSHILYCITQQYQHSQTVHRHALFRREGGGHVGWLVSLLDG